MKSHSQSMLFREYLKELFDQAGKRAYLAIVVLIAVGLTQGVGLLMLIPFC